ncbi:chemotaxis protein CheR [Leptospira yasudae]|uniref:CheR family methyltransferase n=1 Tax=Leptospira yasudae TaxID=2202201 RepID=UPI000E599379|nr:CheR family methyltransferase [Leptospira yasudae]RHX93251.1 chemotaxis protein CheR [Leptospira yasudae]TGK24621.1 protein-glutamate O-methyltransferase CheR [Leptospira yasudae]TGM07147.1 protein-glutamate O-methyltransferase CheR [Leptospira yasudae]
MKLKNTQDIEIELLLEAVFQKYGYDFRQYSEAHIRRRILNRLALSGLKSVSELQFHALRDEIFAAKLLQDLSITVTEMFRDPDFYVCLREKVIPILKTYPFVKIWHAGCSTGEEVYSMAIVLSEEGLYERSILYATDFNEHALRTARDGIFRNESIKEYTANYGLSGGRSFFSDYYTSDHEMVIMNRMLKRNIVWANHNLVTDGVFAEVNLILCRNVLIYFKRELQNKVHRIFRESLVNGGILCLGSKEGISLGDARDQYDALDSKQKIYKKKYE